MKLAILTDTHAGVRSDSVVFLDDAKHFYQNVFFPYLEEHGIADIFHLGDLFDRRKYVNYYTLHRLKEDFLEPLNRRKLTMTVLCGNHDVFYKNTNSLNSLSDLERLYPNIAVYTKPTIEVIDGMEVLLLPWMNQENFTESMEMVHETKAQICFGHLEFAGFEMYRGSVSMHGLNPSTFQKFDMVLSGHFHHRSTNGTIFYLGTPFEMTWADFDDPKGFHIFDTETRELTFVPNPKKLFAKFIYDDTDISAKDILDMDIEPYKNTYMKIIVKAKNDPYLFDLFIKRLEHEGVHDLQVVEQHITLSTEQDEVSEAEDTLTILKKFVENSRVPEPDLLTNYLQTLYHEALAQE